MTLLIGVVDAFAVPTIPAVISGTVTVDGSLLTDPPGSSYSFTVTNTSGVQYTPVNPADGFLAPNNYSIAIPIFDPTDVPGGANVGETAVIHVTNELGCPLLITSPTNARVTVGAQGSLTDVPIVATFNQPPVANAGVNQTVDEGDPVTLNGTNSSDPNTCPTPDTLSYAWTQTAGTSVVLTGADTATPSFTAPSVGPAGEVLTFQLTVTDSTNLTDTATVNVTVSNVNIPPVADAGPPQTVDEDVLVTLNGTNSSDPDGSVVAYAWTQTGGPTVTLTGADTATPTFTTPQVTSAGVVLTFSLVVTDDLGLQSNPDTTTVTITWQNNAPVANAGPDQTVTEGTLVTLNGTNSYDFEDGSNLTYAWTQTAGPTVTLSSTTSPTPTFTAPNVTAAGATLTFSLVVTDQNSLSSTPDTVNIQVTFQNQPPVADAGPNQMVDEGDTVTLDGSGSYDPDAPGDFIDAYLWTQLSGPAVTLANPNAAITTFTAPNVGPSGASLVFQLQVTDSFGMSSTDTVTINVSWLNTPPVADAGPDRTDYRTMEITSVQLDGSGSFDEDTSITYQWTQLSGPAVTLSDPTAAQPSFIIAVMYQPSATYEFQLRVSDGSLQDTDTVTIEVVNTFPKDGDNSSLPNIPTDGNTTVSTGGGGCTLGNGANGDMTLVLLVLAAAGYLVIRRVRKV